MKSRNQEIEILRNWFYFQFSFFCFLDFLDFVFLLSRFLNFGFTKWKEKRWNGHQRSLIPMKVFEYMIIVLFKLKCNVCYIFSSQSFPPKCIETVFFYLFLIKFILEKMFWITCNIFRIINSISNFVGPKNSAFHPDWIYLTLTSPNLLIISET